MLRHLNSGRRYFSQHPVPPLRRANWEFYVALEGQVAPVLPDGRSPALETRTLWVFSPESRHGWRGDEAGCERLAFHFSSVPEALEQHVRIHGQATRRLSAAECERLRQLHAELAPHFAAPTTLSPVVYQKAVCELTLLVLGDAAGESLATVENAARGKVEAAIAWFAHHMHENPKLEQVAGEVLVSTSHLRRLFYRYKGESPVAFFRRLRLRRAEELMETSVDKLEVIARRCGFSGAGDLCRNFRVHLGTTPGAWRQQAVPYAFEDRHVPARASA